MYSDKGESDDGDDEDGKQRAVIAGIVVISMAKKKERDTYARWKPPLLFLRFQMSPHFYPNVRTKLGQG